MWIVFVRFSSMMLLYASKVLKILVVWRIGVQIYDSE